MLLGSSGFQMRKRRSPASLVLEPALELRAVVREHEAARHVLVELRERALVSLRQPRVQLHEAHGVCEWRERRLVVQALAVHTQRANALEREARVVPEDGERDTAFRVYLSVHQVLHVFLVLLLLLDFQWQRAVWREATVHERDRAARSRRLRSVSPPSSSSKRGVEVGGRCRTSSSK